MDLKLHREQQKVSLFITKTETYSSSIIQLGNKVSFDSRSNKYEKEQPSNNTSFAHIHFERKKFSSKQFKVTFMHHERFKS